MPKPQHIHEIYIRTTPERLWQALTDPEMTQGYYRGWAVRSTWETGAPYEYLDGAEPAVAGEILEADPPRRLVTTFTLARDDEAAAEAPSRVTWEITPVGDVCRLTLVHSDFGGLSKTWALTRTTWTPILSGLKTLLETGSGLGPVPDVEPDAAAADLDAEGHRELGVGTNLEVWDLLGRRGGPQPRGRRGDGPGRLRLGVPLGEGGTTHRGQRSARRVDGEPRPRRVGPGGDGRASRPSLPGRRRRRGPGRLRPRDAHEALARAAAADGRADDAQRDGTWPRPVPIADDEDRAIFLGDLVAEPWFGVELPTVTTP